MRITEQKILWFIEIGKTLAKLSTGKNSITVDKEGNLVDCWSVYAGCNEWDHEEEIREPEFFLNKFNQEG